MITYIGSYFSLQAGLIKGNGYLYASCNALAAMLVLLSLAQNFNLSSAIIQVTYIGISIFGMLRFYILTRRVQFSEEEMIVLGTLAPNLEKGAARRLLNIGTWSTKDQGDALIIENEPVDALHFILDAHAVVSVDKKKVGELEPNSLAGEMSWVTGMPASATVTIAEAGRVFSLGNDELNKFIARNPAVRHERQARFAGLIGNKLMRANAALASQS